jgi:hypothetical protein
MNTESFKFLLLLYNSFLINGISYYRDTFEVVSFDFNFIQDEWWSWDSSVGIATGYWLDGRGLIPRRGKILLFFIASRLTLRLNQPPIQLVAGAIS